MGAIEMTTYKPREFDRNEHVLPIIVDGKTVEMHTITLWMRERSIDDETLQSRYTTYIKSNCDTIGARKYIGNWMLPAHIEIELPPAGTKRSSWGDGCERIIVGLTPDQIKTVLSWSKPDGTPVKYRFPTRERHERKSKKTTVTTATKKQMGERDETINGKIVKTATNGIPNIDTINASINGARKQLDAQTKS